MGTQPELTIKKLIIETMIEVIRGGIVSGVEMTPDGDEYGTEDFDPWQAIENAKRILVSFGCGSERDERGTSANQKLNG